MDRTRVLVAGIGNIFLGDDAFGVAVAQRLLGRTWPAGVRVVDFGIRSFDLALALERCDAAILVDATARGGAPGTLYVLEPDPVTASDALPSLHTMTPDDVLRRLTPGARPRTLRIVGCEPESLGDDDGEDAPAGLSAPVQAAVGEAVVLVEGLVDELLRELPADA
jgi:hydrogenase maturation protease